MPLPGIRPLGPAEGSHLLLELVDTRGVTVVVATHDASLLDRADDVIELHDGRVGPPRTLHDPRPS